MPNPQDQRDLTRGPAVSLYRGIQGRAYHDEKRALIPGALPWVTQLRAEKFQRYVKPGDIVFEFGVGSGWNLASLRCARRIGFDAADFLVERLSVLEIEFVGNLAEVKSGVADVVICHHVLEHLDAPVAAIIEMLRVLKPGGTLIMHVPWEREWRYSRYSSSEPNHHLYVWNAQSLGNLLALMEVRICSVGVRRYGYDRFAANLAYKLRMGNRGFRFLKKCMTILRPLYEVEAVCINDKPQSLH